jgi:2-octaprenyl-6-methoxyphenol hydroxylase
MDEVDVLVAGAGPAGLAAATGFAAAGFRTLCVDPAPAGGGAADPAADLRTTAILQPGADLLARIGVWPRLAAAATPLQVMRIVDAGGPDGAPRVVRDFDAADVSERPFGWNLANTALRQGLTAALAEMTGARLQHGAGVAAILPRSTEIRITLTGGARIAARLLVAADGRDSAVRRALGIGATTLRYGQKALVFAVTHPVPHGNVSTEVHRSGGPFTLVPLPDRGGLPASAVVWMERAAEADRLAALPEDAFAAAAAERSAWVLGPLTLASARQAWPIIGQVAARMDGPRTALMAEAAHVVPPIGAQGLNMSLADLALLLDLAVQDPGRLGEPAMLAAYHRRRHPEVMARVLGVDALNRASMAGAQPLRDLRAAGLNALYGLAPLRKGLMRLGMGLG